MQLLYADDDFDFPVAYFLMPDGVEEENVCMTSGLKSNGSCPTTFDLVIKKFVSKRCNLSHYWTPAETSVETSEPPEGSVGY